VTDRTGIHCGEAQVRQPLFNLVFSDMGGAERTCTIQAGQHLLIPLNVVFVSFAEFPGARTDEDLHRLTEEQESSNPFIFLSVDGKDSSQLELIGGEKLTDLKQFRVHSSAFDVNITDNPIFGLPGPTRAVSDGYWVILEALSPGPHQIHFKARLTNPLTARLFYSDYVRYTITVLEDRTESIHPTEPINGLMGKKRETAINLRDFFIEDLNTYEIITLYSIRKQIVRDHPILLTKSGGLWPILLADSYASHYISDQDISIAVKKTREEIETDRFKFHVNPPWPNYTLSVFLEHLLGNEWNRTSNRSRIDSIVTEYIAALNRLEQKGFIKDPPAGENWRIIGRIFEELDNILTDEGEDKINKLVRLLPGLKGESKIPAEVVKLYTKFLDDVIASSAG
jgi:hypothetical protein